MLARRDLLVGGASLLTLSACDRVVDGAATLLGGGLPERLAVSTAATVSAERHLLNRAAFGPWPGDEARVRAIGLEAWIDEQLAPDDIDDDACAVRAGLIDVENVPADLIFEMRPEEVERQLRTSTMLHAVYSRRQLQQVMVGFFTDHFNVHIGKGTCRHLTALHVRDVLRENALGRFEDLLRGVVLSPAMLVYLDGRENAVRSETDAPNENYARELLELHTLGVNGGYTQRDVMEAARCLTGWTVLDEGAPGAVRFDPARHDDGGKTVLGHRIAGGGGERDLDRLISIVSQHPSTARYLAQKLGRLFVAEEVPDRFVEEVAGTFERTGGDLAATVRAALLSEDFSAQRESLIARPFRYVVSTLRALGADTHARGSLQRHLAQMGQAPYDHPTPDGYPQEGSAWLATLLARWRFSVELTSGLLDDARVDLPALRRRFDRRLDPTVALYAHLLGRAPSPAELAPIEGLLDSGATEADAAALMLCSPAYLRC